MPGSDAVVISDGVASSPRDEASVSAPPMHRRGGKFFPACADRSGGRPQSRHPGAMAPTLERRRAALQALLGAVRSAPASRASRRSSVRGMRATTSAPPSRRAPSSGCAGTGSRSRRPTPSSSAPRAARRADLRHPRTPAGALGSRWRGRARRGGPARAGGDRCARDGALGDSRGAPDRRCARGRHRERPRDHRDVPAARPCAGRVGVGVSSGTGRSGQARAPRAAPGGEAASRGGRAVRGLGSGDHLLEQAAAVRGDRSRTDLDRQRRPPDRR